MIVITFEAVSLDRASIWLGVVCVAWSSVRSVAATPITHIDLSYAAPAGCPTAAQVLQAVESQLGAGFVTDTQLRARGDVQRTGEHDYELVLEYASQAGARDQRRLRGESCQAVADAAALVLALALSPSAAPPPTAAGVTATAKAHASAPGARWNAAISALFDTAASSGAALGAGLRLGVVIAGVELNLGAQVFLPHELSHAGITTELQVWSFDAGACYLAGARAWRLGPCAQFEFGRLSGLSRGAIETPKPGGARLQAGFLNGQLELRLSGPLWLSLRAGLEWIARRPQFVVTDVGTVARPETFGLRIALGPKLSWE